MRWFYVFQSYVPATEIGYVQYIQFIYVAHAAELLGTPNHAYIMISCTDHVFSCRHLTSRIVHTYVRTISQGFLS